MGTFQDKLDYLSETKNLIRNSIEAKGVTLSADAPFRNYADAISNIKPKLNIAWGGTAPDDNSKVWVKCEEADEVTVTRKRLGAPLAQPVITPAMDGYNAAVCVDNKVYVFGKPACYTFDVETQTINTLDIDYSSMSTGGEAALVGTKVYFFGGMTQSGNIVTYHNTINVFDTETQTITTLGVRLPTTLDLMAPTTVGSKVYMFGGRNSTGSVLSTIIVFDTETQTITTLGATLPEKAYKIRSAVVGTKIYLFGGVNRRFVDTRLINVFDTETQTVTTLDIALPSSMDYGNVVTVGTKVYLLPIGGPSFSYGIKFAVFDTETQTITTLDTYLPIFNGVPTRQMPVLIGSKIYLFNGVYDNEIIDRIFIFNTEDETLVPITTVDYSNVRPVISTLDTTLPLATSDIASATVGSKVYLFGGRFLGKVSSINVFDTETQTITTLDTTLPSATSDIASATVDSKVYLFGGRDSNAYAVSTINVFDIETQTITTLDTTLPTGCYDIASATVDSKVYLFGGHDSNTSYSTINVFDIETQTITTLDTTLPSAAYGIASATVGSKVYLFGGRDNDICLSTINVFDIETQTITTLDTTLPTGCYDIASATVDSKVYLFGGHDSNTSYSDINVFDIETRTITTLDTALLTGHYSIASATVDSKVYLFGGRGNSRYYPTINAFDPGGEKLFSNQLLITTDTGDNVATLLDEGPIIIEASIGAVYKGSDDGVAEEVPTYLYKNGSWAQI